MDCGLWIAHRGSRWWIQYGGFYIVWADPSGNGGSFVALASDTGDGPGPRQRLMMDPNNPVDNDCGLNFSGVSLPVLVIAFPTPHVLYLWLVTPAFPVSLLKPLCSPLPFVGIPDSGAVG
ncbi:unnamed protein product [Pleuronectes platessa]|uniref:Uncharacterized protein n=1 Tax=Pleuronectes platessa TaxID=8262 RepID=A0A9N7U483_PLEPL|nr:unnamed protein product [Pleuronectes platessa]